MSPFGDLLRALRTQSGKSMGDLARYLEVSVPYVSDVERGHRPPLTRERLDKAATFLGVRPEILQVAAAESRGSFELLVTPESSLKARELGASLMRNWDDFTDDDIDQIKAAIERLKKKKDEVL